MSTEIVSRLESRVAGNILKQPVRQIKPDEAPISRELDNSSGRVDIDPFVKDGFAAPVEDTELCARTFDTPAQLAVQLAQKPGRIPRR